jgi:DNA adenine methylase
MNSGPIKWHGGKCYLAPWIISLMPKHTHYVEPYFGGGSVLLQKDPLDVSEVVNDINGPLMDFWRTLQNKAPFEAFQRRIEATPFSEAEWEEAGMFDAPLNDTTELAVRFFIRCRQSLAGRMKSFTGITKTRVRRRMNNEVSAWLTAIEGLPAVHERLKRVLILNRDALDVIRTQDGPETLFYLDPPYLKETRTAPNVYAHEMTYAQHRELLEVLKGIKGRFLLSGYDNDLYRGYANTMPRWMRFEQQTPNHAAGGKEKRTMTECVWANF